MALLRKVRVWVEKERHTPPSGDWSVKKRIISWQLPLATITMLELLQVCLNLLRLEP